MAALRRFVTSRSEYLTLAIQCNMIEQDSTAHDEASHAAVRAVISQLVLIPSLSVEQGTEIMRVVKEMPITSSASSTMLEALQSKMKLAPQDQLARQPAGSSSSMQEHDWFHNYIFAQLWDSMATEVSLEEILNKMAELANNIGLIHPKEPTVTKIVSIPLAKRETQFDSNTLLGYVRYLKQCLRTIVARCRTTMTLVRFPEDPFAFRQWFGAHWGLAYNAHGDPVPSRVDLSHLRQVELGVPRRSTRTGVAGVQAFRRSSTNNAMGAMSSNSSLPQQQQMMMMAQMFAAMQNGGFQNTSCSLPGFRLCEPRGTEASTQPTLPAISNDGGSTRPPILPPSTLAGASNGGGSMPPSSLSAILDAPRQEDAAQQQAGGETAQQLIQRMRNQLNGSEPEGKKNR